LNFRKKTTVKANDLAPAPPKVKRTRRIVNYWLGNWSEWLGVFLLFLTLGTAFYCVQQAHWINPQPSLLLVLFLSFVLSYVLVKSRLPLDVTVPLGIVGGVIVTLWQSTSVLPSSGASSIIQRITDSVSSLWQTIIGSTPSEGSIYFVLFLVIFAWVLGYVLTWRFLRRQNVWPAVFLGLITVLVNLDYLSSSAYGYFFFYVFAAILLVSYRSYVKQQLSFKRFNARYPLRAVLWSVALVLGLSAILVGGSWVAPEIRANQLQTLTDAKVQVGKTLDDMRINFFAPIKAKGAIIKSVDQGSLSFFSPPNLSAEVQFNVVASQAPSYWRVRRYDIYNIWGWTASPSSDSVVESGAAQKAGSTPAAHNQLTYTVVDKLKTDVVLTAGKLTQANVSVITHTFNNGSQTAADDETSSVTTPRLYKPDESYTVSVNVDSPTPAQLTAAGQQYPQSITSQYLQLPSEVPQSVRRIAQNTVRRAQTPYDKVIAIKNYLAQLNYDVNGSSPPAGVDEVDNFLNVQKSGNCTNFATAAVVLLRSAGIPARLSTGYIPHTWDKTSGTFIVEARDYHAWPEVYFPGYGWVEFEVTPNSTPTIVVADTSTTSTNTSSDPGIYNYVVGENPTDPGTPATSPDSAPVAESHLSLFISLSMIIIALLALGIFVRRWLRTFERPDYASEIYARVYFLASLARLTPGPQNTPMEFGDSLSKAFPRKKEAIAEVTGAYVKSRFSPDKKIDIKEKEKLDRAWRSLSLTILKRGFFRF
jgi:transglutaminase-like putative cysteine protease